MKQKGTIVMAVSGKGGVGKSCLTVTVGRELARLGQRTLLVEMELGLGVLDVMLGLERGVCCLADLLDSRCDAKDCVMPVPGEPGLWALLSVNEKDFVYDPAVFAEKMDELAGSFDWILIETPPGYGSWFAAACQAADEAVIVATPDLPCLRQGREVSDLLEDWPSVRQRLIVNRLDSKRFCAWRPIANLDVAIDQVGVPLLGVVPEDGRLSYWINAGKSLPQDSGARKACQRIARRLLGQAVELGI